MDLKKAQRLVTKIEAFLDNGNAQGLSRLEKDLIRSYVLQLYEAVTDADEGALEQEKPVEFVEYKMPRRETTTKTEVPQGKTPEPLNTEAPGLSLPDEKPTEPKEKPVEKAVQVQEPKITVPPVDTKSFSSSVPEPRKETLYNAASIQTSTNTNEVLMKLFQLIKSEELSGRISHVPIASIESAMGLNERIFTLNELFGGDKGLFEATCSRLNNLNSFSEARTMLMEGPAKDFKWSEPERIKMAEHFIRIVSRRYPQSIS